MTRNIRPPTELALVRELARRDLMLDHADRAIAALVRQGVQRLPELLDPLQSHDQDGYALAAASAQPVLQTWVRTARLESRGALSQLPPGFADEPACIEYLRDRFAAGQAACSECGSSRGCYLAKRRVWECGDCDHQQGLRVGTVAQGSSLPLKTWFEAIRWLLWRPTISTAELAEQLQIERLKTVCSVATRIRSAIRSENASTLLAGLDGHFAQLSDRDATDRKQAPRRRNPPPPAQSNTECRLPDASPGAEAVYHMVP